jgi:hypothetical protein
MSQPDWMGRYTAFVFSASTRPETEWPARPEYWKPIGEMFARNRLTFEAAKDATRAAWERHSNHPDALLRSLSAVIESVKAPNLPANGTRENGPCPLCGFEGLLCIEHADGSPIWERFRDGNDHAVKHITVVCTCTHGARIRTAHGDKLPWRQLANADRRRWQPVGGWPGEPAPATPAAPPPPIKSLAAALAEAEDDFIPF